MIKLNVSKPKNKNIRGDELNPLQTLYEASEYRDFREMLSSVTAQYPENNAFIIKKDKTKKDEQISNFLIALGLTLILLLIFLVFLE